MIVCRGVRGAIVAHANTREAIIEATQTLLLALVEANTIELDQLGCIFFTTTPDLTAAFPALAARELGWTELAFLCGHEIAVPDSLTRCIRVLMLWNTTRSMHEIVHCYLGDAIRLRPERATPVAVPSAWMTTSV